MVRREDGVHTWMPGALVACALIAACGGKSSEKGDGLHANGSEGAGASAAVLDASNGGAAAEAGVVAGGTGSGGAGAGSCMVPAAIDPATWPTCSVVDGGIAAPVPEGLVLAESTNDALGEAAWVAERLYFAANRCSCYGRCPALVEGCPWSIDYVDPCSLSRVPVVSGSSYTSRRGDAPVRFQFASTADAVFWVTYGDNPPQYPTDPSTLLTLGSGALFRAAAGSTTATRLRGSDGTILRTFAALTAHGDRLYWVESVWNCTSPTDCAAPPGRLVSAPATLESLPDNAITVLHESADTSDAAPDGLDLSNVTALAVDGTDLFVLSDAAIHRLPLAGGPAVPVTDCLTTGFALAVDDSYAYVAGNARQADAGPGPYSIVRVSRLDGSCHELTTVGSSEFTVHGDQVYFVEPGTVGCQSAVRKMPRGGGLAELVTGPSFDGVSQLAVMRDRLVIGFFSGMQWAPAGGVLVEVAP